MIKWTKKGDPQRLPMVRNSGIDAIESRAGVFRTLGDFADPPQLSTPRAPVPETVPATRKAPEDVSKEPKASNPQVFTPRAPVNKAPETVPATRKAAADVSKEPKASSPRAAVESKVITKDVDSPKSESSSFAPGASSETGDRKSSASARRGEDRQAATAGSQLVTFGGEASETEDMSAGYNTMRGDREFSIYESSPAFRLEPISTIQGITSTPDGSRTTITITSDPVNQRPAGSTTTTTLLLNAEPPDSEPPRNNACTTIVINGDPVPRVDKTSSTQDLENRLGVSEVSTPSVSPLSRGSSHRTTDTEDQSSGTGSTYYLTGGVGSAPFTPLGSTTRLITQGQAKEKFKVDTGWMPAWGTVFTVLSLVVALGNVVRLPRVVFMHGGGVFLLVYTGIMLVLGIPLVFLEIGLGQFCEQGATKLWRAVPLFTGVGYVKILSSILLAIYYPILITISLFYMIWSATRGLPFPECVHAFIGDVEYNHTSTGEDCLHATFLRPPKDDGMWFGINVALMFLVWAIVMICLFKNRKSFRIATYMVVVPVVLILVALLAENIVRNPAAEGVDMLFTFDWNKLLDIEVWYFATIQMFFSTHLGFGNIITSGGRLYPQSNAFWTATLFVLSSLSLGIVSVIIAYYYIGQLQPEVTAVNMPEVFVFTLFYDAMTQLVAPDNQVWAAFGYLAFAISGLAAMLTLVMTVVEVMTMELNKKLHWSWWQKTGIVCCVGFLLGVPSLLPYQLELVHILDHYVIGRMVIASTILELIGIAWIYGCTTLYTDFEFILGYRLNPLWKYVWWIAPVLFLVVEIWSLVSLPLTGLFQENGDALWVFATGWTFYLSAWIIIIVAAIHQVTKQIDYNLSSRILSTLKPSRKWGPVDTMYRHNWHQWRTQATAPGERDYTLKRRGTKDYTHTLKRTRSPQNLHFQTTLSPANTIRSNRGLDKEPYTIPDSEGHVCWRGNNANSQEDMDHFRMGSKHM